MLVGLTMFFSIAAFVISLWYVHTANFGQEQVAWTVSGPLDNFPQNHVLAGLIPITMTLPNNMLEWVGKEYTFDCPGTTPQEVKIQPGALTTTWDGVNTKITCTGPLAGFSFRVIRQDLIRITSSSGVVLSP